MLSYQHGYHAGNFADVIKHTALTRLLHYLIKKDNPLFYLETHAGRGVYDLHDKQALKTNEASQGIAQLWLQREQVPAVFSAYLDAITALNPGGKLRYYPGSPHLATQLLRPQDRLVCCELHPKEFACLEQLSHTGKRLFYKHEDGMVVLNASLPPIERRGLVFIDPSYEIKTDYRDMAVALKSAYQRFGSGVYCLWYPLVDKKWHEQLVRGLTSIGADSQLRAEFYLTSSRTVGMTGCGLWIINPPYVLKNELIPVLKTACELFNPGGSSYLIE